MKKLVTTANSIYSHVKRHTGTYIVLGIFLYLFFQIYKMVSDNGLAKDGKFYYEDFDDHENHEEKED